MSQTPSATDDLDALKKAARKAASAARKQAREDAGPHAIADFTRVLLRSGAIKDGDIVSGFLPIGSEINPTVALESLRAQGNDICLPCVIAPDTALVFRLWSPSDPLVDEDFGTKAPAPYAKAVDPDVLLVPMLAFDAAGYRLGYGGGFYDRSLEALRAKKTVTAIGIAYSGQEMEGVPRGPYDQPLDWIITEAGARQITE